MDKEIGESIVRLELTLNWVGKKCIYCDHEFTSPDDIKERGAIVAKAPPDPFELACEDCWNSNDHL